MDALSKPRFTLHSLVTLETLAWFGHFRITDIKRYDRKTRSQSPTGDLIGYTLQCLDMPNPGGIFHFFESEMAKFKATVVEVLNGDQTK